MSTTQSWLHYTQLDKIRFKAPIISTLLPKRLVYSDFLVLVGKGEARFHTKLSSRAQVKGKHRSQAIKLFYRARALGGAQTSVNKVTSKAKGNNIPFPGHSQGFLYLHQPDPESGMPRSASSIRFRCVSSFAGVSSSYVAPVGASRICPDPYVLPPPSITKKEIHEAFKAGHDLTLPSGIPWSISVVTISGRPNLEFLRLQLLEDKLFSESELEEYKDIHKNAGYGRRSNVLYTLNDVFPVRFNSTLSKLWVVTTSGVLNGEKASQARFENIFTHRRKPIKKLIPYIGAAHVRLELAPGSDLKCPALSLRVIKITEPVKCVVPDYNGYIHMPKEGELITRGLSDGGKPWMCRLNPSVKAHSAMLLLVPGYVANTKLC